MSTVGHEHLSDKGKTNLTEMEEALLKAHELIATSKEDRLATGLDLTNKLVYTNKGELIETFIKAYGITMDYGANKYDYSNFEKAPYVYADVLDCIQRHWSAFCAKGEDVCGESKNLHLGHIVARCAFAVMKAERLKHVDNPDATRFIGWDADEIEDLLKLMPKETFASKLFSPIKPKKIPYVAHVTPEMLDAVIQSPFFGIIDNYSFRSWCKTFELSLIAFIISTINGEDEESKTLHAKVLLWLAINIYYLESKEKSVDHIGYYHEATAK